MLPLKWLYKATKKYYGSEGQQSIDPVVFFRLMLIGYLENLGSDRRIISTVQLRLDMLYFIGYDIDEALPWHSTLSRTRQLYGEEVFRELFRKVLGLCVEAGMVEGKRQALDSVAVQANASMDSLQNRQLKEDTDTYFNDLKEGDDDTASGTAVKSASEKLSKEPEKHENKTISNTKRFSTTDGESRVSVKPGKVRRLNYLAQVSVDTSSHVITHIESAYADKKDSQCLPSMLINTISNLGMYGLKIEEVMADGNYSSVESLQALQREGITGYIPNFGPYKSTREGFIYDEATDSYECANGKRLPFKGIRENKGHGNNKIYVSSSKDCRDCPMKAGCLGKSAAKMLTVLAEGDLFKEMESRLQSPMATVMRKLRSSTVEPVLGSLVNYTAMRRVNTKGILLAGKCMTLAAIAYNIKKLLKQQWQKMNKWLVLAMKSIINAITTHTTKIIIKKSFLNERVEISLG